MSNVLAHWGRVTHICFSKLTIIASDNGLSPGRRQAIIWTSAGILLIWHLGTNFNEISIEIKFFIQENAFESVVWEMTAMLSRPQCVNRLLTPMFGANPFSEPMMGYRFFISLEHISVQLKSKYNSFIQENGFVTVVCKVGAILSRFQCVSTRFLLSSCYAGT